MATARAPRQNQSEIRDRQTRAEIQINVLTVIPLFFHVPRAKIHFATPAKGMLRVLALLPLTFK